MTAPRGHVQIPRSLLYSTDHGGLAVWAWAMYETLMPHGLGDGRAETVARRCFLAERAGTSTTALDDARRELFAPAPGGPYLSRSAPRGSKRSVKHATLRLSRETGERYVPVPAWTLDLVWTGRRRPASLISVDAWRLYASCVDRAHRVGRLKAFETTVGRLGTLLNISTATGRRRLAELETAGLLEVTLEYERNVPPASGQDVTGTNRCRRRSRGRPPTRRDDNATITKGM